MGEWTGIEWTDATWNPVTGCTELTRAAAALEQFRGVAEELGE